MMTDLPEPLVAEHIDLRDFAFMPLDVRRLRDSDLAADETPEACWAAVLLWCASWHQTPAASIPANEQWIAKQCGYLAQGRISPQWKKVKAGALRGWVECSDGRLYHPVVAEKAIEAWRSKMMQRWRTECARIKKHAQRHKIEPVYPEFDEWVSLGCPQGQTINVPGTQSGSPEDVPSMSPENSIQGTGKGIEGKGIEGKGIEGNTLGRDAASPKRRTRIPDDFALTPDRLHRMQTTNPAANPHAEFTKFRDHHTAHGSTMADWDAAWRTWCSNSVRFGPPRPVHSPATLTEHNVATMQEFIANGTE